MAESIFTVQTPGVPDDDDGVTLTLGTRFTTSVPGTVTAIRWFFPTVLPTGTVQGRLYRWTSDTTGTLLGSADFVAPVAGAWNTTAVSIPIVPGQRYVTAVRTPNHYVATAGLFNGVDIVNGSLSALRDDAVTPDRNGKLLVGDGYPSASFGPGNGYLVDIVFEAASTAVTGNVGPADETDTAFPVTGRKTSGLDIVGETDVALPLAGRKAFGLDIVDEIDTAFPLSTLRSVTLGVATEVDTAFPIDGDKEFLLGVATEVDIASAVTVSSGGSTVAGFVDGPCDVWPVIWPCALTPEVAAVTGVALEMATGILWARSGRRFSLCETTMRPCRDDCSDGSYRYDGWWAWPSSPRPRFYQGVWTNVTCGFCSDGCSCSVVSRVRLPVPVASITSVVIDGVTLSPSAYAMYDYRTLIRQDGGEWPRCNDLSRPAGEAGTWTVTAVYGEAPPALGQLAVGELAVELARAIICDNSCQLPQPVQQLTRQGVSMSFLDPNEVYAGGRLGLRICDMFLSTYNPDGLRAPSRVYSVDMPTGRIPT